MDSGPTLDVIDGICDDDEEEEGDMEEKEREVWGRLFPLIDAYYKTGALHKLIFMKSVCFIMSAYCVQIS